LGQALSSVILGLDPRMTEESVEGEERKRKSNRE